MRHKVIKHSFGRSPAARKALIRGLVQSLVEHGRIKTTVAKAKELRRHIEKAVTIGRLGSDQAKKVLLSKYPHRKTVTALVEDVGPRFKDRPGGYTRIIKVGHRPGDSSDMALIEFVDYKPPEPKDETTVEGDTEAAKIAKMTERKLRSRKKHLRRLQSNARSCSR